MQLLPPISLSLFTTLVLITLSSTAMAQQLPSQAQPPEPPPGLEGKSPRRVNQPFASSGVVGYTPMQIRHAYGLDQITNGGLNQTIGIVVAYGSPTAQNDLNVFSDNFGIPRTTIQIISPKGKSLSTDAGWALETSLDVQWAHAIAPKAKIVLSIAPTPSLSNLLSAVDAAVTAGAKVISMSWGSGEFSTEAQQDSHFSTTGVSYFAASGDSGSTAGTMWPAASSKVTAVGGTTPSLDSNGNLTSAETAWSGSGGGFSLYITRPSYQNGWQPSANRAYPDVALVANPSTGVAVFDSTPYNGSAGWWQVGGTSASSPMWAASVAIGNELRSIKGKTSLSGVGAAVYNLAGSVSSLGASLYSNYFYDVTSGNTGNYSATPKYDETTGLGTPVSFNLLPALATQ